jgi:hypothetical protein
MGHPEVKWSIVSSSSSYYYFLLQLGFDPVAAVYAT